MSMMTPSQLLNHLYYKKLPKIYRDMDSSQGGLCLYRYLSVLVDKGYGEVLNEIKNLIDLIDPEKCPEEFLPFLCESFGVRYHESIPVLYQRRLLSNYGEFLKRRGTYAGVRYTARAITGLNVDLEYSRGYNVDEIYGRWLTVNLRANTLEDITNLEVSKEVIKTYVEEQVPYYITVLVTSTVSTQPLILNSYRSNVIASQYKHYSIA